jgi:hypothetical protein
LQLPLDNPQFVELTLGKRIQKAGATFREDTYRARLDNHELKLVGKTPEDLHNMSVVRFEVPPELQKEDDLLFVCFIATADEDDLDSLRPLCLIRWH